MRVAGLLDSERAVVLLHQPAPAGTEDGDRLLAELLLELLERAEVLIDGLGQRTLRLATAVRAHAVPEEGVVPDLGSLVEDSAGGLLDDLLERHVLEFGARNQVVELVDVRLMMLAMVKLERLCRHVRLEGILDRKSTRLN